MCVFASEEPFHVNHIHLIHTYTELARNRECAFVDFVALREFSPRPIKRFGTCRVYIFSFWRFSLKASIEIFSKMLTMLTIHWIACLCGVLFPVQYFSLFSTLFVVNILATTVANTSSAFQFTRKFCPRLFSTSRLFFCRILSSTRWQQKKIPAFRS